MPDDDITIEVNGREADQAAVSLLDHEGWGHFTAMQVRAGRARGLDLHLSRLEAAHREVYGRALLVPGRPAHAGDRTERDTSRRCSAQVCTLRTAGSPCRCACTTAPGRMTGPRPS